MLSPGLSPPEIQSHLYASLLQADAYDVAIHVTGTWKAVYKLHRVVLIQSVNSNKFRPSLNLTKAYCTGFLSILIH